MSGFRRGWQAGPAAVLPMLRLPVPAPGEPAGRTVMDSRKLPLTRWFQAANVPSQARNNVSALELMRHLGVSYPTAWSLKHKLMALAPGCMVVSDGTGLDRNFHDVLCTEFFDLGHELTPVDHPMAV